MNNLLIIGIIVTIGFATGELAARCRLPRITGYLLAGIMLDPDLTHVIPPAFTDHTELVTNISLSFITFSIGGMLYYPRIKSLGSTILAITFWEAELAFVFVAAGFFLLMPVTHLLDRSLTVPFALLMAALASPTDPAASLAVKEEYHAQGQVTSTIMGVAALDDIMGILNFSVGVVLATAFLRHDPAGVQSILLDPLQGIALSVLIGALAGFAFNVMERFFGPKEEGGLIVILFGFLLTAFGAARHFQAEELLATMTMGIVVVNFGPLRLKLFALLERYTHQLIFVLFFTISGMHLNFALLWQYSALVLLFVFFRTLGKFLGVQVGARLTRAPEKVRRYVGGGLIPQGGIVVGLALLIRQNPQFSGFSEMLISLVIGTTVVHEIAGPLLTKVMLTKSGELNRGDHE